MTPLRQSALLVISLFVAACTGAASPSSISTARPAPSAPTASAGGGSSGEASARGGGAGAASGGGTVQGNLVTSGLYSATWTWAGGDSNSDLQLGGITLTSDKGTFGNIRVKKDGSIAFGSGAAELAKASDFHGTGAGVKLGPSDFICGVTLDSDLKGSGGEVLHMKGTLTLLGEVFPTITC